MEVTEEEYKAYYKEKRRQKYIDERSCKNGDFSYDSLDSSGMLGESVLVDIETNVEEQVINKMTVAELRKAMLLLSPDERELIKILFIDGVTERKTAENYDVSQVAIHKRKNKILAKLVCLFERFKFAIRYLLVISVF